MKIYIAIVDDRHADTDACAFSTAEKAIEFARAIAAKYCRHEEDLEEVEIDGWVFCVNYSCESDSVHVIEKELDSGEIK